MPTDFRDAAERHWQDACHLHASSRIANADHLYGLSAECALKAVMQGLGMRLHPGGLPHEKQHQVHVNKLWEEFAAFVSGRGGERFLGGLDTTRNPFADWDAGQRYHHRTDILPGVVEKHRSGAHSAKVALDAAVLDGVVP